MFNIIVATIAILAIIVGIRIAWYFTMEVRNDKEAAKVDFKESEKAVEITVVDMNPARFRFFLPVEIGQRVYGPETFEMANMTLRLTKPHLFAVDWYESWRREFSAWSAEQWFLIDQHQQEMRIGAYAS